MSKHLHYKTEYCWNCGNVATGYCSKCGMPICSDCGRAYGGKCDVCWEDMERAEMRLSLGSMDNAYTGFSDNQVLM